MELTEVVPGLHLVPLGISDAYVWRDATGATLVDTGPPGSGPTVRAALEHPGVSPAGGVLLTGDTLAEHGRSAVLGPFDLDRAAAWRSLQRLAALDVDVVCRGHGSPLVGGAAAALRRATEPFG